MDNNHLRPSGLMIMAPDLLWRRLTRRKARRDGTALAAGPGERAWLQSLFLAIVWHNSSLRFLGVAQCGTTSKETEERKHEENKEVDNGTGAGEGSQWKETSPGVKASQMRWHGDLNSQWNATTWGLKEPMKWDDMGTQTANEMRRHGD